MAACSMGKRVILTEETDWIGGQLTAQLVPPDEHPWIEQFGCTARYRRYRECVRQYYRDHRPLTAEACHNPLLNPGGGWVSRLCHEPAIGHEVLRSMLQAFVERGFLEIRLRYVPIGAEIDGAPILIDTSRPKARQEGSGERVRSVEFLDLDSGERSMVEANYFIDATELGELLPMTGTSYAIGAEAKTETEEPHAVDGPPEWNNVQGLTWCMAMGLDEGSHRVIDCPETYERWRNYQPSFWPGPLLGFDVLHAHTGQPVKLPLFSSHWYALFPYRQIVNPAAFTEPTLPATVVNWPQNDYFLDTILDVDDFLDFTPGVPLARGSVSAVRLLDAQELSKCLLYWLQTEAPRHDGGVGYPGLYLRADLAGTADGFAKTAYIRESRRILAQRPVLEQDVTTECNPSLDRAPSFDDSVGIGAYRIDLHPSTSGENTFDASTLPFEIPMGALIPQQMRNLLPACKNLGVTHITNGCYRLHPVEWNIGESAGALAAFCVDAGLEPLQVYQDSTKRHAYQDVLQRQGIELRWPQLRPL